MQRLDIVGKKSFSFGVVLDIFPDCFFSSSCFLYGLPVRTTVCPLARLPWLDFSSGETVVIGTWDDEGLGITSLVCTCFWSVRQSGICSSMNICFSVSSAWSPYLLKHINAIEKVQKRFTKRIYSLSHLSYPERLAVINLQPLELRRLQNDLVMYFTWFVCSISTILGTNGLNSAVSLSNKQTNKCHD